MKPLRDKCGVFGILRHEKAAELTYFGLYALQHRGQESAGIATDTGRGLRVETGMGRVVDVFREEKVVSAQSWEMSRAGQHIELGIAENNLFLTLAALGLAGEMFGTRLLPIGTLYDPFIARGLDALNYACYQDARFMLVGTPSGVTLAPEGGAQQRERPRSRAR